MKMEYMLYFVESAQKVLEQISGSTSAPGPVTLMGSTFSGSSVNVATRIEGALQGQAVCSMSSSAACQLAGLAMGTEVTEFDQRLRAGMVSLVEMWGEQAQKLLAEQGLECEIGGPIVFRGLNVEFAATLAALVAPIETPVGRVDIIVALQDGSAQVG